MHTITLTRSNISGTGNNQMVYSIPGGTNLEGSEIALSSLYMYFSWENINDAPLANNTLKIWWPPLTRNFTGTTQNDTHDNNLPLPIPARELTITIPNGIYEVSDINAYLQHWSIENNLYLINDETDEYVYFIQLQTNVSRYAIQFNSFSLPTIWVENNNTLLDQTTGYRQPDGGFCNTPLITDVQGNQVGSNGGVPGTQSGTVIISGYAPGWVFPANFNKYAGFPANYAQPTTGNYFTGLTTFPTGNTSFLSTITPEVNPDPVIFLNCNLVQNKFSTPSTFLFPIPAKGAIASLLNVEVSEFAWNKMIPGNFNELRLFFTNAQGQPIKILDPNIIVTLVIKEHADKSMNIGPSNIGGIPHSANTLQHLHKLQHNSRGASSQHGSAANLFHQY